MDHSKSWWSRFGDGPMWSTPSHISSQRSVPVRFLNSRTSGGTVGMTAFMKEVYPQSLRPRHFPDVDSSSSARQNLPMNPREREDKFLLKTYAKPPIPIERGERNPVFASDGRRYLDLYGGHAVTVLGHSHPKWVEAISRQAATLGFYSSVSYS